jgi:hypothetical protein
MGGKQPNPTWRERFGPNRCSAERTLVGDWYFASFQYQRSSRKQSGYQRRYPVLRGYRQGEIRFMDVRLKMK